ncbi:tetrapyrrole biosynthesis, uroporphyrinogen III synthase [Kickxella alabastrina]|uniref:tetrapyrrole biosynthesis, uroporphyrinogen III synthase n=1 Tax=Kickxella alabastrina TaxID=61397 RepID=UPI00221F5582|nr:tetrapyrrole biosynthesis, uroporphyrinogen III synthase [Kickxella alabastrina]KAI7823994.1 tetrapyrrole biosynthesis, uroporphyrinogen III synthase [Kickxella alabastrina]
MDSEATISSVILFRDGNSSNAYTELLEQDHASVENVVVLEHQDLITTETISDLVGPDQQFAAILFTSQNAVKALSRAANTWLAMCDIDGAACNRKQAWARFLNRPVFVVGRATGSTCRDLLYGSAQLGDDHSVTADIRGQDAGRATVMLPEIIDFCAHHYEQTGTKPRLVFFCGDQRRDTLPDGIRQSGQASELIEVVSYTTVGRPYDQTRQDLSDALGRISALRKTAYVDGNNAANLVWMVLFSPSGVRVVSPVLNAMMSEAVLQLPAMGCRKKRETHYRLVAIGETTMSELVMQGISEKNIVMAKEPSAQGIRNAICGVFAALGTKQK